MHCYAGPGGSRRSTRETFERPRCADSIVPCGRTGDGSRAAGLGAVKSRSVQPIGAARGSGRDDAADPVGRELRSTADARAA
jgi:hypothetical protein